MCGTVVALTDAIGRVVAQYGYTPYGDLLAAELFANGSDSLAIESLAAARGNRLGHQGLRTERFDRPWDGPMDIASAVTGGTGATGRYRSLCHNRNRLYDPAVGRFTGVDPNGLGVPVLDGLALGGMAISAGDVAPDLMGHYGDGMNAHVAYAAMPRGVRDPSGLSWDPFDMVDDYVSESAASVAALMTSLRGDFDAAMHIGMQIAQLHPAVAVAVSAYRIANGTATWEDALSFIPGGALARGASRTIGRAMAHTVDYVGHYASRGGNWARRNLARGSGNSRLIQQGVACARCMDGATRVWTPDGPHRLDELRPGDLVLTEGDRTIDADTGRPSTYDEADAIGLWHELRSKSYRLVHMRIDRSDGSTTDVRQLMDFDDLASLGYEAFVGADVRLWVPDAGRPHSHGVAEGGWATVLSIGPPVSMGDGLAAPTAAAAPVMATFTTTRSAVYAFDLDRGGDGACESIEMTATHPVWCESRGRWVAAGTLSIGGRVRTADGPAIVTGIRLVRSGAVTSNLSVAGGATFFVGEGGVWVHNTRGCLKFPFHHYFPRQLHDDIKRYGISQQELETWGERIFVDWHLRIHGKETGRVGAWNDRWRQFFRRHPAPPAGRAEALRHLQDLLDEFGF